VSGVQPTLVERLKELMALFESATLASNPVEVGQILKAKVVRTTPSKAEVVVNTTVSGSVDLSELTDKPAKSVEEIVTVGDEIVVKALAAVQEPHGLILSRQQALEQLTAEGKPVEENISSESG
jgi:ribosomal protein S1